MKSWIIKSGGTVVAITTSYELVVAMTSLLEDFELIVSDYTRTIRWAVNDSLVEEKIDIRQCFS